MILKKQEIINTEVTKNNRRYPREVLMSIRDQINNRDKSRNVGQIGYPEGMETNLRRVAFTYSNAVVEDDVLYADIEILETEMGDEIKRLLELEVLTKSRSIRFRPAGSATIKGGMPVETLNLLGIPNVVSEDYKLLGIHAIYDSEDAINLKNDI